MHLQNTTLDDLAAVIGFTATLRLAAWFGDSRPLFVPANVEDGQLLVRLVGMDNARRLSAEWPGQHLDVPRLRAYENDVQRRMVCRMVEQGFGPREIGVHLRMGERRVQQIAKELEVVGLLRKMPGKSAPEKAPPDVAVNGWPFDGQDVVVPKMPARRRRATVMAIGVQR